jgi:hypothetical protein
MWNACGILSNSFYVSFDSLAPVRLTLQGNLWFLYLKGPVFTHLFSSLSNYSGRRERATAVF